MSLYTQDFNYWCKCQSALLRSGRFDGLDLQNLAKEIEDMGNQQEWELFNRLTQLILHLLKCKYQSSQITKSWKNSIVFQRDDIEYLVKKNPSLKPVLEQSIEDAYKRARKLFEPETGISVKKIPVENVFTVQEILDSSWFPE